MISEVAIDDFRQHCRPKHVDKKSIATRLIHQVLLNDLAGIEPPRILTDKKMIDQVKSYSSNQLIELACLINLNRAVMIEFDFDVAGQIIPSISKMTISESVKSHDYEIVKLFMRELSIQCANNFRSVYENSNSGVPIKFLRLLVTATPVEVNNLTVALSEHDFIKFKGFPESIDVAIEESKCIFSQDDSFIFALKLGATKPFIEYFFPEHCYSDPRSISILRKLTGDPFEVNLPKPSLKPEIVEALKNEKYLIETEYKQNHSFEELKMRLFKFLVKLSEGENTSLKMLWSQYKRSITFDNISTNIGETS